MLCSNAKAPRQCRASPPERNTTNRPKASRWIFGGISCRTFAKVSRTSVIQYPSQKAKLPSTWGIACRLIMCSVVRKSDPPVEPIPVNYQPQIMNQTWWAYPWAWVWKRLGMGSWYTMVPNHQVALDNTSAIIARFHDSWHQNHLHIFLCFNLWSVVPQKLLQ